MTNIMIVCNKMMKKTTQYFGDLSRAFYQTLPCESTWVRQVEVPRSYESRLHMHIRKNPRRDQLLNSLPKELGRLEMKRSNN